jgi:hypothetical protein
LVFQSFNGQLQVIEDNEDDVEVAAIYNADEVAHISGASMETENEISAATLTVLDDDENLPAIAPAETGENPK